MTIARQDCSERHMSGNLMSMGVSLHVAVVCKAYQANAEGPLKGMGEILMAKLDVMLVV